MTSSLINPPPTMGYDLSRTIAMPGSSSIIGVSRGGSIVRVLIPLSWIVGITGNVLAVSVIDMLTDDLPPVHLKTLEDLDNAIESPMVETYMTS